MYLLNDVLSFYVTFLYPISLINENNYMSGHIID